jgi:hypothetical protein
MGIESSPIFAAVVEPAQRIVAKEWANETTHFAGSLGAP